MSFKTCRFVVATSMSALAIPVGFAAPLSQSQQSDDPDRKNGDLPLTILQTKDLHDHANGADHVGLDVDPLTGRGVTGSYARIAAYVNYVRASAGHLVILVDSGDWTMGTFYDLTRGKQPLALSFLTLMRYDCVTLGNHEFDYTDLSI